MSESQKTEIFVYAGMMLSSDLSAFTHLSANQQKAGEEEMKEGVLSDSFFYQCVGLCFQHNSKCLLSLQLSKNHRAVVVYSIMKQFLFELQFSSCFYIAFLLCRLPYIVQTKYMRTQTVYYNESVVKIHDVQKKTNEGISLMILPIKGIFCQ